MLVRYLTSGLRECHVQVPVFIEITEGDVAFQVSLAHLHDPRQSKDTPAVAKERVNVVAGSIPRERSRDDKVRDTVIVQVANLNTGWQITNCVRAIGESSCSKIGRASCRERV